MKPAGLIGLALFACGLPGCGGNSSEGPSAKPLLDTAITVDGQGVSFASMKNTLHYFHMGPQKSPSTGDSIYSDAYLVAFQCSLKVVSETYVTEPVGGRLKTPFLTALLLTDRDILDSSALPFTTGADSGRIYSVVPKQGKSGFAGKVILAAKANRSWLAGVGTAPDSASKWKDLIDSLCRGFRFSGP